MAGSDFVERGAELPKFALATDEPLASFVTLAFSGPQDAYRRSADFFLSQKAIPLESVLSVSKMAGERKIVEAGPFKGEAVSSPLAHL